MPPPSPTELKRALIREGFEIYRTAGTFVLLADRVRENLIMDSGVALGPPEDPAPDSAGPPDSGPAPDSAPASSSGGAPDETTPLVVRVVLKTRTSEFPGEASEQLLQRAQALAGPFQARGYAEARRRTVVVKDPGDAERTIDTCYEIHWECAVVGLPAAVAELRYALAEQKAAGSGDEG